MFDSPGLSSSPPHWATAYIGTPWQAGAQGPEAYDCWGFFRHVQAAHFGRQVPEILIDPDQLRAVVRAFAHHPEHEQWAQVSAPAEGDAVLLAHAAHPSHVGVWVGADGGGVLHCVRGQGVVFSGLAALAAAGWGHVRFYRRAD